MKSTIPPRTLARSASLIAVLAACLAGSAFALQDDEESLAKAMLELAEKRASKGHFEQALSTYRKLAKKYPATEAGRTAERRTQPNAFLGTFDVHRAGPSDNRVDVVIMGDGYTLKELDSFQSRAEDMLDAFEREPTLAEYLPYFNLVGAAVMSAEGGVDGYGRDHDTALGAYVTSKTGPAYAAVQPAKVVEYLRQLPAEDGFALVLVKDLDEGAPSGRAGTIGASKLDIDQSVHAFGHAFAGLGDEFTGPNEHPTSYQPAPNLSDTGDRVPWQHWLDEKYPGIGVYEGAVGRVGDYFRPYSSNCVMNEAKRFCPVCREAVVLAIYEHVDAIEAATPAPIAHDSTEEVVAEFKPTSSSRFEPLEFEIRTLLPESHSPEVTWWLLPEHRAPRSKGIRVPHDERVRRGPLPEIELEPVHFQRTSKSGVYEFEVDPNELEPGRYRVVVRAVDTTKPRGEREPWVLRDERGLLQFERGWWIRVPPH